MYSTNSQKDTKFYKTCKISYPNSSKNYKNNKNNRMDAKTNPRHIKLNPKNPITETPKTSRFLNPCS